MPSFKDGYAPWNSLVEMYTGSLWEMIIECDCEEFTVPDYAFDAANAENPALKNFWLVEFRGMDRVVIGNYAFRGNEDLGRISTYLKKSEITKIGVGSFMGCKKLYRFDCNAFTNIPDYAFCNCEELYDIKLDEIKTIGKQAFMRSRFDDVGIDLSSATSVGEEAFSGSSINKIIFGPSTDGATFGSKCFAGCSNLKNIDVSSALTSDITANTFYGVTLSNVTLNVGPRLYGDYYENHHIFGQMKVNKLIDWPVGSPDEGWEIIRGRNEENCVLRINRQFNSFTSVNSQPWRNYREFIKTVDVDYSIDCIGPYEFADLPNVVSVHLPYSIKTIGNYYSFKTKFLFE